MATNQICIECGSDDLKPMIPDYPNLLECGNCGHPNDGDNLDCDWSEVDKTFSNARMDEILGLENPEPDYDNMAQERDDDIDSPDPNYAL